MIKTLANYFLLVSFGLLVLSMALAVVISLVYALSAIVYRLVPGPNVPINYNIRNMLLRWKNLVVTLAAFVVVTGILVVMLAFVAGMYNLTENSGRPGNVMVLQSGSTDETFSNLPPGADVQRLSQKVREDIIYTNGDYLASKEVYVIVNQPIPNAPPSGKQRRFVQMRGIDKPLIAAKVHDITLQEGTWISPQGVQLLKGPAADTAANDIYTLVAERLGLTTNKVPANGAIEVVIGAGIARELGTDRPGGPIKVGEVLDIGGRKWIVVGIMSPENSTFTSEVWARDYIIQNLFGRQNSYSTYVVSTGSAEKAERLAKGLKDFKEVSLNAVPEREYYSKLSATNRQFTIAIAIVAVIMAVGGVLGVMNTMYAAISQRAKDIGVLRLLGYTRWQILVSFLLESIVLAVVGGALGCAIGYLFDGLTATSIVSSGQGGGKSVILKLAVTPLTIGICMLLAFIMGAVGGLVPAISAMRLKPLESLR